MKRTQLQKTYLYPLYILISAALLCGACKKNDVTQSAKTVRVATAGGLGAMLSAADKLHITILTVSGVIDARDFKTLRDSMPNLQVLDISGTSIVAYTGKQGTADTTATTYPANTIPAQAFCDVAVITADTVSHTQRGNTMLTTITLPPTITTIGVYAFYFCTALNQITIPVTVTSIQPFALEACTATIIVDGANSVYSSNAGVLFNKAQDTLIQCPISMSGDYVIPSTVTDIESLAFNNCSGCNSITIPKSVVAIGVNAFADYRSTLLVDAANPSFSCVANVLFNKQQTSLIECPNVTGSYTVPSTVTVITSWAFSGCYGMTAISIPSSVTAIGVGTFGGCSGLTSITIPASVTLIGALAFEGCSSLTSLHEKSTTPPDLRNQTGVFTGLNTNTCTLYIPTGAKAAYQSANQWGGFLHIVEE